MRSKIGLLLIFYSLTIGAGISMAVDIKTAPMEQNELSISEKNKQQLNIGQRDPEKEKTSGVWVDFFLSKKIAVGGTLYLSPQEYNSQYRQNENTRILGFDETQLGGGIGLKFLFK